MLVCMARRPIHGASSVYPCRYCAPNFRTAHVFCAVEHALRGQSEYDAAASTIVQSSNAVAHSSMAAHSMPPSRNDHSCVFSSSAMHIQALEIFFAKQATRKT